MAPKRPRHAEVIRMAVLCAAVSLLSYFAGSAFTANFHGASASMGGLWSLISAMVVLQASPGTTSSSAWLRVLGTLIGAIIAAAYLSVRPFGVVAMAVCVGLTVLLCQEAGIPDHARLAAITVALIMVISSIHPTIPPVINSALRFGESCIGTVIAVAAGAIWPHRVSSGETG
jgi:uncharacterized membrane protein YccC